MNERRLLILDDDPSIGQTMGLIAETVRFATRFTSDPERFFALVDDWSPTHIALDLVMPTMDGVEVMVQLARRGCGARIIVTSGVGSRVLDAAGRSAEEHGLDIAGVLSKPFSPAALRALLADAPPARALAPGSPAGGGAAEPPATFVVTVDDLRRALADDQVEVHYQPKIDCASGRLAGFEALVRWRHPLRGLVSPGGFVRVAEQGGMIDALTDRVFDLSLPWFARSFPGPGGAGAAHALPLEGTVSLSVNISARSLHDRQLADRIHARCAAAGIAPSRLILELTETSAMEDPVASLDLLTRLRMKGFQLSIDDFGTGFSSMLQLVRLPFSEMKVDRSFVMTLNRSQESRAVVRSVVELGHSLGLRCTAEGVEDERALDYLRQVGCDLAQGFLIGRPMPAAEVPQWLAQWRGAQGDPVARLPGRR
jgi:EAL domain-containing protein (putative c-di-GMP-specific phosphodiesterase class I)